MIWTVVLTLCLLFLLSFFLPKKKSKAHGSAVLRSTAKNLGYFNKGVKIGSKALSRSDSTHNLLLLGSSGTGKTTNILLENIFHLAKKGYSLVILDPKHELVDLTSGFMKERLGLDVFVLDLLNPDNSIHYNPFSSLKEEQLQGFVTDLHDIANENKSIEAIWKYGAIQILTICCKVLFHYREGTSLNLQNVLRTLQVIQSDPEDKKQWLLDNTANDGLKDSIRQFFNQETKVFHSIISSAIASLVPFISEEINAVSYETNLPEIRCFRTKQSILYISLPIGRESSFMPYITLFLKELFTQILNTPVAKEERHIGFILEEFGQLQKIPSYESIIATIRSRKAFLFHCLQNLDQLSHRYGDKVANIVANNCSHWLVLTASKSEKTNNYIVETLTGRETSNKSSHDGIKTEFGRPLFFKDELRRLPKNKALFISSNLPPALIKLKPIYTYWFKKYRFGLVSSKGILDSVFLPVTHENIAHPINRIDFENSQEDEVLPKESFQEKLEKLLPKK